MLTSLYNLGHDFTITPVVAAKRTRSGSGSKLGVKDLQLLPKFCRAGMDRYTRHGPSKCICMDRGETSQLRKRTGALGYSMPGSGSGSLEIGRVNSNGDADYAPTRVSTLLLSYFWGYSYSLHLSILGGTYDRSRDITRASLFSRYYSVPTCLLFFTVSI
jgi:hypothetical protein